MKIFVANAIESLFYKKEITPKADCLFMPAVLHLEGNF